ncbi:hypothetical protein ACSVIJ_24790 [Pseudomonas sp. NCHU5208]|uniref:hypothetical protein n=1 Tax=unclassified Pseudomonas TaxID=196821 RepID=UPI003F9DEFC0
MTGMSQFKCLKKPIVLPASIHAAQPDQASFADHETNSCVKTIFSDVAYITGQRRFWLLPERLRDLLVECHEELAESLSQADKDTRNNALARHGLHEPFIPVDAYVFLNPDDQGVYDGLEEDIRQVRAELEADEPLVLKRFEEAEKRLLSKRGVEAQRPYLQEYRAAQQEIETKVRSRRMHLRALTVNRQKLRSKGYAVARSLGFHIENKKIYGAREVAIRTALEEYNSFMAKVRSYSFEEYNRLSSQYEPIWNVLDAYKKIIISCDAGELNCRALNDYREYYNYLLEYRLGGYIEPIIRLANLGIATPEFALSIADNMASGLKDYQAYMELMQQKQTLISRAEERYEEFVKATGGFSPPPAELLEEERAMLAPLQKEADRLFGRAQRNMLSIRPSRRLLWDTNNYVMREQDSVCNDDIPLRELSLASSKKPLVHISLYDLAEKCDVELASRLKKDHARTARYASLHKADPDMILTQFLERNGAISIEEQDSKWFDKNGVFLPGEFFSKLNDAGHEVQGLEAYAEQWGQHLTQMVFEDSARQQLILFDTSYQAQFVRMLGMGSSADSVNSLVRYNSPSVIPVAELDVLSTRLDTLDVSGSADASGIDSDPKVMKERRLASAELGMTVNLARAEVDLVKIELPPKSEAVPVELRFIDGDGQEASQSMGSFYLNYSVVAWGFAGVSLMMAREIALKVDEKGLPSISGIDFAERSGLLGKLKLYAGAEVGCTIEGGVNWRPPKDAAILNSGLSSEINWITLLGAKLDASIGAGVGIEFDFNLMTDRGRLMLCIKAAVFFGPGAKGAFSFEVNGAALDSILMLYRRILMKNNFRRIHWIDENAFTYLSKVTLFGCVTLGSMAEFGALLSVKVDSLIDEITGKPGKRAGLLAYTIANDIRQDAMARWFLGMPPETLGPLLYTLTSTPHDFSFQSRNDDEVKYFSDEEACEFQQVAIYRCLLWVKGNALGKPFSSTTPNAAQILFQKALERMSIDSGHSDNKLTVAINNRKQLDSFMGRYSRKRSVLAAQRAYNSLVRELSLYFYD